MTAGEVGDQLRAEANPEKAVFFPRFFKAGEGEYAAGDKFLGVTVPVQRRIAKNNKGLPLDEVIKLLQSDWHEERLTALFILVSQFNGGDEKERAKIYQLYLKNTKYINNWDLVDSSAPFIMGTWLDDKPDRLETLLKLASSELLWERRIAMLATFYFINKKARADEALVIAEKLINDPHDLIQKAVGWMLREVGKRIDRGVLKSFLSKHYKTMPRTTLRYAIEHFDKSTRARYLSGQV